MRLNVGQYKILGVLTFSVGMVVTVSEHNHESTKAQLRLGQPSPVVALEVASLGRRTAAADLLWLRAVQFIGAPGALDQHYDGLGPWIETIVTLDPKFETAYFMASMLLSTEPAQAPNAAKLLMQAEEQLVAKACSQSCGDDEEDSITVSCEPCYFSPECNWQIPMWRGFVAYFGLLDAPSAAQFFCDARRRGGPAYLGPLAERLRLQSSSCRELRAGLQTLFHAPDSAIGNGVLGVDQQLRIIENCEANALRQASGAYRLRFGTNPKTVYDLVKAKLVEPPFSPPGLCWTLGPDGWNMVDCTSTTP